MSNGIEGMNDNDRLNGGTPSLSDLKKEREIAIHKVRSDVYDDRLNGGTPSLSDLKKEITPLGITPPEIVSAIDKAGIKYNGDKIITRGGDITIGGVTYKNGEILGRKPKYKGPFYQINGRADDKEWISFRNPDPDSSGEKGKCIQYRKNAITNEIVIYWGEGSAFGTQKSGKGKELYMGTGHLLDGTFTEKTFRGVLKYGIMRGGTMKEDNYAQYEGYMELKKGKYSREGDGTYKYENGMVYKGIFKEDEKRHGKLDFSDGNRYDGDFVNGVYIDKIFTRKMLKGNLTDDELKKLNERIQADDDGVIEGTLYEKETDSKYKYTITSGKIDELSDNADFITMFGSSVDESWATERGNVLFEAKIDDGPYTLHSWDHKTERKLSGGYYDFGDGLKISIDNPYGIKLAKHMANLINYFKNYKAQIFCDWSDDKLVNVYEYPGEYGTKYLIYKTTLLERVSTHFGGINAKTLANWLNKNVLGKTIDLKEYICQYLPPVQHSGMY